MKAILYPSRLTITPEREKLSLFQNYSKVLDRWNHKKGSSTYEENFKVQNNPFILSSASKRKIFDSINSMYVLSKPRTVNRQNGKQIFNFRMSFITLTLPSKQVHDDTFIKSHCLNQFLIELSKKYSVKNYVWKAELQKNKNIHFHLVTDQYIDYQALRRHWNRIINKYGYVDKYSAEMSAISLMAYHAKRVNNFKKYSHTADEKNAPTFESSAIGYAKGKRDNWQNPNSVDVRAVHNKNMLGSYLAKYIGKDIKPEDMDEETSKRSLAFGRSWSRSYSLAQLKFVNKFDLKDISNVIDYFERVPKLVKKFVSDYYTVYYFAIDSLDKLFQKFHNTIMLENAKLYRYPLPS